MKNARNLSRRVVAGYKAIVPVDSMSSEDPYMEQYAAWHMFKGGPAIITSRTTVTRSDMIKF